MKERVRHVRGLLGLVTAVLLLGTPALAAADITYIYDELGRLRAVIDPSQTDGTAIYTYDAAGNILSITRQPSTQVSIIEFLPDSTALVTASLGPPSGFIDVQTLPTAGTYTILLDTRTVPYPKQTFRP